MCRERGSFEEDNQKTTNKLIREILFEDKNKKLNNGLDK